MKTAAFDPRGGPIRVSIRCRPRRDGSYELRLWEANENTLVAPSPWLGNFVNDDDDDYTLPGRPSSQAGRQLQCLAVIAVPGGAAPATVSMIVSQGGKELRRARGTIAPGTPAGLVKLWLQLDKEA